MASVNKVIIVGNLGKDPEMRAFPSGDQVASVTIATSERWKDKQTGEMKEATEWHRVEFFGRLAEVVGQYLRKGSQVYVEGSLRTRKWVDKTGIERFTTEIRADKLEMLGSRQGMGAPGPAAGDSGGNGGNYGGDYDQPQQSQPPRQYAAPAAAARPAAPAQAPRPAPAPAQSKASSGFEDMDDDIPF